MSNPTMEPAAALALSRSMVRVVKETLLAVMRESEEAVMKISDTIQTMTTMSAGQKKMLNDAFEGYYNGAESESLQEDLNATAKKIEEAALEGRFDEVDRLAADPGYKKAVKATKKLHDALQGMMHVDDEMNEQIIPVLIALQFQDKLRQDLEMLNLCFEKYFAYTGQPGGDVCIVATQDTEFWNDVISGFTSVESRELVSKTVFGR